MNNFPGQGNCLSVTTFQLLLCILKLLHLLYVPQYVQETKIKLSEFKHLQEYSFTAVIAIIFWASTSLKKQIGRFQISLWRESLYFCAISIYVTELKIFYYNLIIHWQQHTKLLHLWKWCFGEITMLCLLNRKIKINYSQRSLKNNGIGIYWHKCRALKVAI